jgi:glycosyltransferase involved in cell wall biosynthesis
MKRDIAHFTINGRFLAQNVTGVQRYAREIVSNIDEILAEDKSSGFKAKIVVPPKAPSDYRPSWISVQSTAAGNGIAWEQFILPFYRSGPLLNLCNQAPLGVINQIVCIHDLNTILAPQSYSRSFRMLYGLTQPVLARRVAKVVTVSRYSAAMLARFGYCAESKVHVIPNGHEHVERWDANASSLALAERVRPYVFVLGSQAKHKNVEILSRIAPALDALGIDLLIAGGGAAIFSDARLSSRAPNIVHLGFVSDDDLAALFKHALCFAFPSVTEGFGLPVLEGLALGCPVVASDIPALREVAGDSALYAAPDSPATWLSKISDFKEQSGLRAELREKGLERAKLFSWKKGARAYLDLLRETAN